MSPGFSNRILFLSILLMLVATSLVTYRNLTNYTEEVRWIRHSILLSETLEKVLSTVKDAETGHRGYQLSRDTSFLKPYYAAAESLPALLVTLDSLTVGQPAQVPYLDTLRELIGRQFAIIAEILGTVRETRIMDRYETSLLAFGGENMDKIRAIARKMNDLEQVMIDELQSSENRLEKLTPLSLLLLSLFSIGSTAYLFVRIMESIAKQKKAEREMLAAQRLSITGKIARALAHEVRNPLTNLNLALEGFREETGGGNGEGVYLEIMRRNTNRIEELVGAILETGRGSSLNLCLADINTLIEQTLALASDRIRLSRVLIEKNLADGLPRILVDAEKMKIALLNMIINAIEAMLPGIGRLQISTGMKQRTICVTIADNGKGIDPEEMEKLFEPFYTRKEGGMGLGLSSAKSVLDSHSATVEVSSHPGKGTSFLLLFPLPES